jgi:hypothetical protein
MKLTIPFHSFVDVITNSSTQIYVKAGDNTIKALKELVDNILKSGNSQATSDDLFEISLAELDEYQQEREDSGEYYSKSLVVKSKQGIESSEAAAKVLSNLTNLFNIEANYDG